MKEKIANALKTEYAKLGLSDKAFDGVAAFLEKTITDESEIVTAIKGDDVKGLLRVFQGESDGLRSAKMKAERDLEEYRANHPATTETSTQKSDNPLADKIAELERKQKEYEDRIREAEGKAKRDAVLTSLDNLLKGRGCNNDFIRKTTLAGVEIGEGDTAERLLDTYKSKYDENFKAAYGDGAVPPLGSQTPKEYEKGDWASEVERLRREGKLPQEQK